MKIVLFSRHRSRRVRRYTRPSAPAARVRAHMAWPGGDLAPLSPAVKILLRGAA